MRILPTLWGLESCRWPEKWCSAVTGAVQSFRWRLLGNASTRRPSVFCPEHLHLPVWKAPLCPLRGGQVLDHTSPPQWGLSGALLCRNLWDCTLLVSFVAPAAVWNQTVCLLVNCVSPSAGTAPPRGWGRFCLVLYYISSAWRILTQSACLLYRH